jgi:hypothetical protein
MVAAKQLQADLGIGNRVDDIHDSRNICSVGAQFKTNSLLYYSARPASQARSLTSTMSCSSKGGK